MFNKIASTVYLFNVMFLFVGAWMDKTEYHKVSWVISWIFLILTGLTVIFIPTQILIEIWSN